MSTKSFCDGLRELGRKLATGDDKEFLITDAMVMQAIPDFESQSVVTAPYIRMTLSRVPEIKEYGSVSVKRITGNVDMPDGFIIKVVKDSKRRVLTSDDVAGIKNKAVSDAFSTLMHVMPDMSEFEGDSLLAAVKAVYMYKKLMFKIAGVDDK